MKRLLLSLLLISSISIVGAYYYAYFTYIPEKIENKIIANFKDFGFETLNFEKVTRKNGEVIFSNISLDEKSFSSIGELSVHFSLLKFMLNPDHAQKIIINDMNLSGEVSQRKLTFSGWNNDDKILQSLKNIPADIFVIKDTTIDLLSDDIGGIKINYNGQARVSKSGDIEIKGQLASKQKRLSFQSKINGKISTDGTISIMVQSDQISLTQKYLSIRRGAANIKFEHSIKSSISTISAEGDFSSVNWYNMPLRDVHITLETSPNNYLLSAQGKTFGRENIEWNTEINKESDINKANTTITPDSLADLLSFLSVNKRLQNDVEFPAFILKLEQPTISLNTKINKQGIIRGDFKFINPIPRFELGGTFRSDEYSKNIKGKITPAVSYISTNNKNAGFKQSVDGEFVIRNIDNISKLEWYLNTKINDGHMDYGALNIRGINGKILYSSNADKKNKGYLKFNLPLKSYIKQSGRINLNLDDKNKPLFQSIIFNIYNGTIKAQNPLFTNNSLSKKIKLTISDIYLTEFFRDAMFEDVIIFGQLGGVMPLTIEEGNKININGGILQSQGSGIIKLPQTIINGLFPNNDKKTMLIRKALKNYHYEFFEIRLDGNLAGKTMITLSASGYNPDIDSKQPISLNLHIETQADILFRNLIK